MPRQQKEKEIIIRTNITNGKWDYDRLANDNWNVDDLNDWGVDVSFLDPDEDEDKDKDDKEDFPEKDLSNEVNTTFEVIVECDNEEMQQEIFNNLTEEGYKCRVLTL